MQKIGIIGCGNLGVSLLNGMREKNPKAILYGSKRNISSLKKLENEFTFFTSDNSVAINEFEIIIITLKPCNVIPFLQENKLCFYVSCVL